MILGHVKRDDLAAIQDTDGQYICGIIDEVITTPDPYACMVLIRWGDSERKFHSPAMVHVERAAVSRDAGLLIGKKFASSEAFIEAIKPHINNGEILG